MVSWESKSKCCEQRDSSHDMGLSEAPIAQLHSLCHDLGFHILRGHGIHSLSNLCCAWLNPPLYSNQYGLIGIQFSDNTCRVQPSPRRPVFPWLLIVSLVRHRIVSLRWLCAWALILKPSSTSLRPRIQALIPSINPLFSPPSPSRSFLRFQPHMRCGCLSHCISNNYRSHFHLPIQFSSPRTVPRRPSSSVVFSSLSGCLSVGASAFRQLKGWYTGVHRGVSFGKKSRKIENERGRHSLGSAYSSLSSASSLIIHWASPGTLG